MPLNSNIIAIQTVTVGAGGAATIDFTNILQTYTDLVIKLSARSTANGAQNTNVNFNSNTSGYSDRILSGNGSAASSFTSGNTTKGSSCVVPGADYTSNTFGNGEIYIPNYTGSNNKSFSSDSVTENNATTSYAQMHATLWSNTAAITSISLSLSAGNFAQYSTATLYGVTSAAYGAKATGGTIYEDGTYYYHTFLSSGTFTPTQSLNADILVVAGGGAGAIGGGGAGGLLAHSSQSLTAQNYTITVGAGGVAQTNNVTTASQGNNSQFGSLTASVGGGAGGLNDNNTSPTSLLNGGSGGGGGGSNSITTPSGTGTAGQGNNGASNGGITGGGIPAGGGGGAGAAGSVPPNNTSGGNAGIGATSSLINAMGAATGAGQLSGGNYYFAGGGGGGGNGVTTFGQGGLGGGSNASNVPVANATVNTGGGGGGYNGGVNKGGNGGSGIVIVRYAK